MQVEFEPRSAAAAAKSLQPCPTLCDPHRQQPTRLPRPWDSPGKNTGVGCHFLLQWVKVKSESEVSQSCLTLSDPMDCSPPGSSAHGIFQTRVLEWDALPSELLGTNNFLIWVPHSCLISMKECLSENLIKIIKQGEHILLSLCVLDVPCISFWDTSFQRWND